MTLMNRQQQQDQCHVHQHRRPKPQQTPLQQHSLMNRCLMLLKPPLMLVLEAHKQPQQHHKQQPQHHRQHQHPIYLSIFHTQDRRTRRHEQPRMLPELIDARVISILNSMAPENSVDRFYRSLSPCLGKVPDDRAAILTLIAASQGEQDPNPVLEPIEQWRAAQHQIQMPSATNIIHPQIVSTLSSGANPGAETQQSQQMPAPLSMLPPPASRHRYPQMYAPVCFLLPVATPMIMCKCLIQPQCLMPVPLVSNMGKCLIQPQCLMPVPLVSNMCKCLIQPQCLMPVPLVSNMGKCLIQPQCLMPVPLVSNMGKCLIQPQALIPMPLVSNIGKCLMQAPPIANIRYQRLPACLWVIVLVFILLGHSPTICHQGTRHLW
ncbi:uncharacterized protein LOC143818083 [Ranitomeya variabilis]|uniref:uncharacterized protein LOC143818083 n=1 Tax=Ranitomeya variabilis TaxID=490064 RepID=UPI004057B929